MRIMLPFVGLVLGLAGCVNIGRIQEGNPVNVARIDHIKTGETTKAEITSWFGAPFRIQKSDVAALAESAMSRFVGDQLTLKLDPALYTDVYLYQQRHVHTFFLAFVVFNYFQSDTRFDRLAVVFDPDNRVTAFGWSPADWSR